jgi:hypothetical protein
MSNPIDSIKFQKVIDTDDTYAVVEIDDQASDLRLCKKELLSMIERAKYCRVGSPSGFLYYSEVENFGFNEKVRVFIESPIVVVENRTISNKYSFSLNTILVEEVDGLFTSIKYLDVDMVTGNEFCMHCVVNNLKELNIIATKGSVFLTNFGVHKKVLSFY